MLQNLMMATSILSLKSTNVKEPFDLVYFPVFAVCSKVLKPTQPLFGKAAR